MDKDNRRARVGVRSDPSRWGYSPNWPSAEVERRMLEARDFESIFARYAGTIMGSTKGLSEVDREDFLCELRLQLVRRLQTSYEPREGLILHPWIRRVCWSCRADWERRRKGQVRPVSLEAAEDAEAEPDEIDSFVGLGDFWQFWTEAEVAAARSIASGRVPGGVVAARVRAALQYRLSDIVVFSEMQELFDLIPAPPPNSINTGLSPANPKVLERLLGAPRDRYTANCASIQHAPLRSRMVTDSVGPFKVSGEREAVKSLQKVMVAVKAGNPALYDALGTAGMLCCRLVRGSRSTPSNHSWGTAVDLTIHGRLDPRGDDQVQRGLLALYPYFHAEGWYWGAEFRTEDAMHFELSHEKIVALYGHLRNGVAAA